MADNLINQYPTVDDLYPDPWIRAEDLPAAGLTCTIKEVAVEKVFNPRTKAVDELRAILDFQETPQERLILNKTQTQAVAELAGSPEFRRWPGLRIRMVRGVAQNGKPTIDIEEAPDTDALLQRLAETKDVATWAAAAFQLPGLGEPFPSADRLADWVRYVLQDWVLDGKQDALLSALSYFANARADGVLNKEAAPAAKERFITLVQDQEGPGDAQEGPGDAEPTQDAPEPMEAQGDAQEAPGDATEAEVTARQADQETLAPDDLF